MIIGNFTKQASGIYRGTIATLGVVQEAFVTAAEAGKRASPDYRMLVSDTTGTAGTIETGAAWGHRRIFPKSYAKEQLANIVSD